MSARRLPRGVLFEQRLGSGIELEHHPPTAALRPYVVRFWLGRWDLEGRPPFRQPVIPHPCVNIEIIRGRGAVVSGVKSRCMAITLRGSGLIFGVKLAPGAFRALFARSAAELTDETVPLDEVLPHAAKWRAIPDRGGPAVMVERAEALLRPLLPASVDARLRRVQRIVDRIERDRSILRVRDIAEREGTSLRALQLLFRDWVGVPPKWVIGHYRLQEAADRIESGRFGTLAELAQALGYFDQAHFAREFKAIVGVAPSRYARSSRSAGGEASRLSKPRRAS